MTLKSVETVSAIDLVMGGAAEEDASEQDPAARGPRRLRANHAMPTLVGSRWHDRNNRAAAARGDRRLGPVGLLRGRAPAEEQVAPGPLRPGRHVRPPAHPLGPGARRRGARPPEHQGRQPRLREDRRRTRSSASTATSSSAATSRTTTCTTATTRSSTRWAPRPTAAWASPARTCPGSWAATEFVAWYNGHPDYRDLEFDLSGERAVVVGNGNVAADVARMLALTRDELAADRRGRPRARRARRVERDREIVVLGRRGPAQAAFTNPELLELGEMTDADVFVDARDVELDPLSRGVHRERGRAHHRDEERGDPRPATPAREPLGQAAPDRAALPRLAGGDPRRRARGGHPHRATTSWSRTSRGPCAPAPPT